MAQRLNDDLGGRTVFCDGWAHDDAWLGLLFDAAGLVPRFKLEPVNALLDETGRAGLDAQRALAFAQLGMAGPAPAATRGRCNGRCSGWRFAVCASAHANLCHH